MVKQYLSIWEQNMLIYSRSEDVFTTAKLTYWTDCELCRCIHDGFLLDWFFFGHALFHDGGWGVGTFLRWWPPSAVWAGLLIFYGHHRRCLKNSIFSNLGLCAACWAHFMCHHKWWPTSVIHPFSSLNRSLGLTGRKYPEITIPIFRLIQNFAFPGCFSYILLYCYIFSLLSSGWVVIAACDCFSPGK